MTILAPIVSGNLLEAQEVTCTLTDEQNFKDWFINKLDITIIGKIAKLVRETFEPISSEFGKYAYFTFPNLPSSNGLSHSDELNSIGLALLLVALKEISYFDSQYSLVCASGIIDPNISDTMAISGDFLVNVGRVEDKFDKFLNYCQKKQIKEKAIFIFVQEKYNEAILKNKIPEELKDLIKIKKVKKFDEVLDSLKKESKEEFCSSGIVGLYKYKMMGREIFSKIIFIVAFIFTIFIIGVSIGRKESKSDKVIKSNPMAKGNSNTKTSKEEKSIKQRFKFEKIITLTYQGDAKKLFNSPPSTVKEEKPYEFISAFIPNLDEAKKIYQDNLIEVYQLNSSFYKRKNSLDFIQRIAIKNLSNNGLGIQADSEKSLEILERAGYMEAGERFLNTFTISINGRFHNDYVNKFFSPNTYIIVEIYLYYFDFDSNRRRYKFSGLLEIGGERYCFTHEYSIKGEHEFSILTDDKDIPVVDPNSDSIIIDSPRAKYKKK